MNPEQMDRSEYVRRWNAAARALFFDALRWLGATWVAAVFLIAWWPSTTRTVAFAWLLVVSIALIAVGHGVAACYCHSTAASALRYPTIWRNRYREPWAVGSES